MSTIIPRMGRINLKKVIFVLLVLLTVIHINSYILQWTMKESTRKTSFNDTNIALIVETAKQIKGSPVLVTLVNSGYFNMVYSWICNTKHMGFHKQVLMITTKQEAKEKIRALSPDISVAVIDIDNSMRGNQEYSHVGYVRLMILRTQIQLALLEQNIEVYAFECDSVWLKNPLPFLHGKGETLDILFISNYQRPKAINGGFLYLFPKEATQSVFRELNKMMRQLADKIKDMPADKFIPTYENDQVYLSNLVLQKYAGMRSTVIPFSIFADGKWYDISDKERALTDPYIIHNNWIKGVENKEGRAKKWGHWFLKGDQTCDFEQVKKIVK